MKITWFLISKLPLISYFALFLLWYFVYKDFLGALISAGIVWYFLALVLNR